MYENAASLFDATGADDALDDGAGFHFCVAPGQHHPGSPQLGDQRAGYPWLGHSGGGAACSLRVGLLNADWNVDGGAAGLWAIQRGPGTDGGTSQRHQPREPSHSGAGRERSRERVLRCWPQFPRRSDLSHGLQAELVIFQAATNRPDASCCAATNIFNLRKDTIYRRKKQGDHLDKVTVYENSDKGELLRVVEGETGEIVRDPSGKKLILTLHDAHSMHHYSDGWRPDLVSGEPTFPIRSHLRIS